MYIQRFSTGVQQEQHIVYVRLLCVLCVFVCPFGFTECVAIVP